MRTFSVNLAVLCLVGAAWYVAAETISVETCQDEACTTGCTTNKFQAGQCLQNQNGDGVYLNCAKPPTFCNNLKIYADSSCADESTVTQANNVCESCQNNFTVSCGALQSAIFLAVNCTDTACQNCTGVKIVPFGKCTYVPPLGYAYLTNVHSCTAITVTTFVAAGCSGTNYSYMMESGKCFEGNIFSGC